MSLSKIVCRLSTLRKSSLWTFVDDHHGAAVFSRLSSSSAQIVLLSTLLCIFTFSFYTHNVCTDYLWQKNTFGHWTPLHQPASGHFIHKSNVAIGDSLEHRGEQRPPEWSQEAKETLREMRWNPQQTEGKGSQSTSTEHTARYCPILGE